MAMTDNLNASQFGIMDAEGNHVSAGAGFLYRGYIISMTAIYSTPVVVVFGGGEPMQVLYEATTVEDAIEWCNNQKMG